MASGYFKDDPTYGALDLDDAYVTDSWLVDQFVGNNLFAFGYNAGNLGNGNTINYSSPIQIGALTNWVLALGGGVSCSSIKRDGSLWSWGGATSAGYTGTLGDGTTVPKSSPIQIGTLTNWKQIVVGDSQCAAIKTDGSLWVWGVNTNGSLGDGTTVSKSSPVQLGTLTNWKVVSTGINNLAAIKTDGTLWTWGYNINGGLGDGTTVNKSSPIQVGSLNNWKQISACENSRVMAIKTDGTLWAWGMNTVGQLGDGTTISKSSPIQIGTMNNWKVVLGSTNTFTSAIKTDGTLWVWGRNLYGLGDGTTVSKSSPVQIGSLTDWKYLGAGILHFTAIKTDGTLWAWGRNIMGQLGDGTTIDKSSPVKIGSMTNWKAITSWGSTNLVTTFADIT